MKEIFFNLNCVHASSFAGSVGMFSLQLAHLAGYKVVAVASPRNWELCKALGADAVYDVSPAVAAFKIGLRADHTISTGVVQGSRRY